MRESKSRARGGGGTAAIVWALATNPWLTVYDLMDCLQLSKGSVQSAIRSCLKRGLITTDLQPRDLGRGGRRLLRCYGLTNCTFARDVRRECEELTKDRICKLLAEMPDLSIAEISKEIGLSEKGVAANLTRFVRDGRVICEMDVRAVPCKSKHYKTMLHRVRIYSLKGFLR